jgi:hypothetical protein
MIFCHSFVSDVILRRFFTKLACDKNDFIMQDATGILTRFSQNSYDKFLQWWNWYPFSNDYSIHCIFAPEPNW